MTAYQEKARAEIDRLLEELFPKATARDKNQPIRDIERAQQSTPFKACGLFEFVKEVIMQCFGMGYDYAIQDLEGKRLKSWFTVEEAVQGAREKGYEITPLQAQRYLSDMAEKRLFEYEGGKYRRHCWLGDIARYYSAPTV